MPAALREALAVLLPVDCAGCGLPDHALCPACRPALRARPARSPLADGTPVVSALRYEEVVRRVLLAYKEQGRTGLARSLAPALGDAVGEAAMLAVAVPHPGELELCAVPTSGRSRSRRGYRPLTLLLRRAGLREAGVLREARATGGFGLPGLAGLLDITGIPGTGRRHREQKSLGRAERAGNLAGAFAARGRLDGRSFLLVDDILTTGATLFETARAVRAAGGTVVSAATLAFTPRRHPAASAP
jgi:predicted amidophosphoribosyltransferase